MKQLSKTFFKDHPLMKRSPAAIVYYRIESNADAAIREQLQTFAGDPEFAGRFASMEQERAAIDAIETGEALVSMLRKPFDPMNQDALLEKAQQLGQEAMDAMIRRFRTSFQDEYIEAVIYIFAKSDRRFTEQLLEEFPTIRNPYARSLACLLFGMQKLACTEDLLLQEYEKLLRDPRDSTLAQGPLLALHLLHDHLQPLRRL